MHEIGFVQGRLSRPVDGRIQAFPVANWRVEFPIAEAHGFALMEWVVDAESLDANPLLTPAGRREIRDLCSAHSVRIGSVMCDFLMVKPFYKGSSSAGAVDLATFARVVAAANEVGIPQVIIPLVDGGRLETEGEEAVLRRGLDTIAPALRASDTCILFECDYSPAQLAEFIAAYPADRFGVNYDIGNSASWGYDPAEEFAAYGPRVLGVHVKDRPRGGSTVPLEAGDADLPGVFRELAAIRYQGNYMLQTARASSGDDVGVLCRYREMVAALCAAAGSASEAAKPV